MTNRKRIFATILALSVVLAMIFSVSFIVTENDHKCMGEDCPVCYQISLCENMLKSVSLMVFLSVAITFLKIFVFVLKRFTQQLSLLNNSLIQLKVKLSN